MTKPYGVKVEDLVKLATQSVQGPTTGEASTNETTRNTEAILLIGAAICERLERIVEGNESPRDRLSQDK